MPQTAPDQTEEQFARLYGHFVPRLYRAALYLLGDGDAAGAVAAQVWTEAFSDPACRADERAFSLCADRLLVGHCAEFSRGRGAYSVPARDGVPAELVRVLARTRFSGRCLLVLAAVEGRSVAEIAGILRRPSWIVSRQLARETEKLCRERLPATC